MEQGLLGETLSSELPGKSHKEMLVSVWSWKSSSEINTVQKPRVALQFHAAFTVTTSAFKIWEDRRAAIKAHVYWYPKRDAPSPFSSDLSRKTEGLLNSKAKYCLSKKKSRLWNRKLEATVGQQTEIDRLGTIVLAQG